MFKRHSPRLRMSREHLLIPAVECEEILDAGAPQCLVPVVGGWGGKRGGSPGPGEFSDGEKTVESPAGLLINGVRWRREPRERELERAASPAVHRRSPRLPMDSFPACIKWKNTQFRFLISTGPN